MPTEVTLYYADWCEHCKKFKPEWDALKTTLDQLNIDHHEYEDAKDQQIISEDSVQGFPTIRIKKENDEYEYIGPRTASDLLQELGVQPQVGGATGELVDFHEKYLKYKDKYASLKKWMDNYKKSQQ